MPTFEAARNSTFSSQLEENPEALSLILAKLDMLEKRVTSSEEQVRVGKEISMLKESEKDLEVGLGRPIPINPYRTRDVQRSETQVRALRIPRGQNVKENHSSGNPY